jgi:hypothetical protein
MIEEYFKLLLNLISNNEYISLHFKFLENLEGRGALMSVLPANPLYQHS